MTTSPAGMEHARGIGPEQEWQRQAATILRKARRLPEDSPDANVWSALAGTTVEGLRIPPLGVRGVDPIPEHDGRRAAAPGGWDIRARIVEQDATLAAATALDEWQNGSTSLWLAVGGAGVDPAELGSILSGIPLDEVPIVISATGSMEIEAAQHLSDLLASRGPAAPGTSLGGDPVGRMLRAGSAGPAADTIRELAVLATNLGIGALVADGAVAHQQGAGDAAEIGYALAAAVFYLRELQSAGHAILDALPLLEFRLAATDDQFAMIAKFRAVRVLWNRIAELSGGPAGAPARVHAVTSRMMMTRYDPWTNLLRTTVAAFGAGVGGADVITVEPFDVALGVPDAQGRRLARNISALLVQEAHVRDVADPAGGSWVVEQLTDAVADAAWDEFLRIEESGGIMAAIADGSLRSRFASTRERRTWRITTRQQPITGVSEFPNLTEDLPARLPYPASPGDGEPSWASPFELMRDTPSAQPVFLGTLGPVAVHMARAGFVTNALAAGGVGVVRAGPTDTVEQVIAAYRSHPSTVVCVVGSDAAYAESAASVVAGLRGAGARWVILAGRPSPTLGRLVDDHYAAGDDLLAFLGRTRNALSATDPAATIGAGAR